MRITRPPLTVPFYLGALHHKTMQEPSRKAIHLEFSITDDGEESDWLKQVHSIPMPTFGIAELIEPKKH